MDIRQTLKVKQQTATEILVAQGVEADAAAFIGNLYAPVIAAALVDIERLEDNLAGVLDELETVEADYAADADSYAETIANQGDRIRRIEAENAELAAEVARLRFSDFLRQVFAD